MCGTDRSKRGYFSFGFVVLVFFEFVFCLGFLFVWGFLVGWVLEFFWLVGFCFALIEEDGEASESY